MKRMIAIVLMILCIFVLGACQNKTKVVRRTYDYNKAQPVTTTTQPSNTSNAIQHEVIEFDVSEENMIVIGERLFVAQTNDVYFNTEDYVGKTFKYEGIFHVSQYPGDDELFYSVIRYGPGCCGIDANAGFEVKWDQPYPNPNDWVEVIGVLEIEEHEAGYATIHLRVISMTVLDVRGAETVTQ